MLPVGSVQTKSWRSKPLDLRLATNRFKTVSRDDNMIKAVFFDLWDTLLVDRGVFRGERNKIILEFLKNLNKKTTLEEIDKLFTEVHDYIETRYFGSVEKYRFGMGLSLIFERLGVEVDKEMTEALEEKLWKLFLHEGNLRPHAKEILSYLKRRGYKLAVVTNWSTVRGNEAIDAFDLRKYFDSIVVSEDVGGEKSTTLPFRVALEKLGLKSEEVVMVGDRDDEDVFGAKLLGMKAVKIHGSHRVFGETRKADYEINDLIELKEILRSE